MARRGDALYLRGNTWYLTARINGVRHQKRLGKNINRSTALELAHVMRSAILRGEVGVRKKKDLTFEDARKRFEAWATANLKPRTVTTYQECLRRLSESFAGKRVSQISAFSIEGHKQLRLKAGARVRANREIGVLKNMFNRLREWKQYEGENPVKTVKATKEPQQRLRFLESDEEARLLALAPDPLRSLLTLCMHSGLRLASEALTLRWDDIDLVRRTVTVSAAYAKSGHTRSVPLNSRAWDALNRLPKSSEYVFVKRNGLPYRYIRRRFNTVCGKAGLRGVTPHVLRHTFATRLIASGVDLRTVQELGGWSEIEMLKRYGHVTTTRKAEAVERLVENCTTNCTTFPIRRIGETAG